MNKCALLLISVSFFTASPVMAFDGNKLIGYCKVALESSGKRISIQQKADVDICVAMVQTVSEFERIVCIEKPNAFSCMPDNVVLKQKIREVYFYLKEHPEKLHIKGAPLIMAAFAEAFPCP